MKQLRQRQEVRGLGTEVLFELSVGTYLLTVVVIFWQQPVWASLLLGGAIGMELGFWQYHYPFFRSIGLPLTLQKSRMPQIRGVQG
jgi:hypothetical protein